MARSAIEEDEELFRIPRANILTVETSQMPSVWIEHLDSPWLSLIVAMVYEYLRGSSSVWKPYFDVIPKHFDTLMYWDKMELQYLEGSAVLDKIGKQGADEMFTERLIPIIRQYESEFAAEDLSDADLSALCHRMGSTIMAYAFDLEHTDDHPAQDGGTDGEEIEKEDSWEEDSEADGPVSPKGMIPLADMLNADADLNNAKLFYHDDDVVMKTIKRVKAGEELFNDYGPLPRSDVLRRYGYVTNNYAKYDVVEISRSLVERTASDEFTLSQKDVADRTSHLDDHTVLDDAYDISREEAERGQFSEEFCILLNILTTSQADFENMKQKGKFPKPVLSEKAQKLLHFILERRVQMYPKIQNDVIRSETGRRFLMASQVVHGEIAVVREALKWTLPTANEGNKRSANEFEDAELPRKSARTHE